MPLRDFAVRHPRLFRHLMNWYPCYRGTGGRVTHIADDWSEIHVRLPLGWRTRNYVGTTFGGSIYGCIDPNFMFMLMHRLGPDYTVWDKSASVRFRRPGRTDLTALCRLPEGEEAAIKAILHEQPKVDRTYHVDLVDREGTVHATIEKVVHVSRRAGSPQAAAAPAATGASPPQSKTGRAPGRA